MSTERNISPFEEAVRALREREARFLEQMEQFQAMQREQELRQQRLEASERELARDRAALGEEYLALCDRLEMMARHELLEQVSALFTTQRAETDQWLRELRELKQRSEAEEGTELEHLRRENRRLRQALREACRSQVVGDG